METSMGRSHIRHTRTDADEAERRICGRIRMKVLGGIAVLESVQEPGRAIPGRLVNVSGGGCCLVVPAEAAARISVGERCTVSLPVAKRGLHHPATVASIDPYKSDQDHVRLRLRFRTADRVTQQRLIKWLGEMAVRSWHVT